MLDMTVHGPRREEQRLGDGLIGLPEGGPGEHLQLAGAQSVGQLGGRLVHEHRLLDDDAVVGAERSAYQWPVRSAFDAGVTVCASSDAPITEPDWRQGIAGMLLRESRASGRASGPEQCVGLAEALRAYTINAARQDFADDWKGSVEVGKVADLCVLDRPLLELDPHDLTKAEVDLTVFDGRVVFER